MKTDCVNRPCQKVNQVRLALPIAQILGGCDGFRQVVALSAVVSASPDMKTPRRTGAFPDQQAFADVRSEAKS